MGCVLVNQERQREECIMPIQPARLAGTDPGLCSQLHGERLAIKHQDTAF